MKNKITVLLILSIIIIMIAGCSSEKPDSKGTFYMAGTWDIVTTG